MRPKAATTILAVAALAGCGGSSKSDSGIPASAHNDYIAGCVQSGQTKAGCDCLFDNLTRKQGVNTQDEFKALATKIQAAAGTANPGAALPPEFRQAAIACKALLVKKQ